jgi:hypothetical protein
MKSAVKPAPTPTPLKSAARRSTYVSAAKTKALLAGGAQGRAERAEAADMLSVAQAARRACTTVSTIRSWIVNGRAIALERPRNSYRLPGWQFESAMWEAIPQLAAALDTNQGWALLGFLESPCGALNGRTPRQAIEQGDLRRVLQAGLAESY